MPREQVFYILKGHEIIPTRDIMEWGAMFEDREARRVAQTHGGNNTLVSTVFLGMDHGFGDGPPLLFETMVFRNDEAEDEFTRRCSTWAQAEQQHREVCIEVLGHAPGEQKSQRHRVILED